MQISDGSVNSLSSEWIHFEDYELKENEKGELFICPTGDSKVVVYKVFDVINEIVPEILNIGRFLWNDRLNFGDKTPFYNMILEFVRKYGLLGQMNYFPYNNDDYIFRNKVYLPDEHNIDGKTALSANEYIDTFIPFTSKDEFHYDISDTTAQVSHRPEHSTELALEKDSRFTIIFSRFYCEKMDWFVKYAKWLYRDYFFIKSYYNPDRKETQAFYKNGLSNYTVKGIRLGLELNEYPTIIWDFSSLRSAIDMMFGFLMGNKSQTLKSCKHDDVIFYAKNPKSLFCSERCRNQYNVYKSRRKASENTDKPPTN
ncbi:hypothetical protein LJB89_01485 [Tyzzerella sp. OttesenSCG-928-J15]|nr:hypothetical protein [Tyzzerella sp. OttesenSCG-928-J15]